MEEKSCVPGRNLDIFVKRILARNCQPNEQIVFDVATNPLRKVPLRLCIGDLNPAGQGTLPVQCIADIKFLLCDTNNDIICNHKSRVTIDFKLLLLVKYNTCTIRCLTLPEEIDQGGGSGESNIKVCTDFDGAVIGNQSLEIVDTDEHGPVFRFTKNIPFTEFDDEIPQSALDDPTLQSHVIIRNIRFDVDVNGRCRCPGQGQNDNATIVDISVFADIIDKIGIDQDVWVNGIIGEEC
jgi:hypothetical protein